MKQQPTWKAFMWVPGARNHLSSPPVVFMRFRMDAFRLSSCTQISSLNVRSSSKYDILLRILTLYMRRMLGISNINLPLCAATAIATAAHKEPCAASDAQQATIQSHRDGPFVVAFTCHNKQ